MSNVICYHRVSTARQGASGLGLEAQQAAVSAYLQNVSPVASYTEVESGRNDARPELAKAIAHCQRTNSTLIVAKLDRLARSQRFLLALRDSGVRFKAVDMPDANELTISILIAVAEAEAKTTSERTSRAIQAKLARGEGWSRPDAWKALEGHQKSGAAASAMVRAVKADKRAESWRPVFEELLAAGLSNTGMARILNGRGERTSQGGLWTATAVRRLLGRLELAVA